MPTIEREEYAKNIRKAYERMMSDEDVLPENRRMLEKYIYHLSARGLSESRIYKYLVYLHTISRELKAPFGKVTKSDIEKLLFWINNQDLAESTKRDYKVLLKTFYKWIGDGEYPDSVKWVKPNNKKVEKDLLPEDLLTEEDVLKMIAAANSPRDRAFIAVLWESGARIGEILDLKIKSFEDYRHGKKVVLHGKTGARKISLISSVPYVQEWLAVHPNRDDREADVWVNIGLRRNGGKMRYAGVAKMLRVTASKAGIKKPVNPHHFRHSRATYLATKFTEQQLCQWFGWVIGSDVPRTYVHLSGKDLDGSYEAIHGIVDKSRQKTSIMAPKTCPRCGTSVESTALFCYKCGMALDLETAQKVEEAEDGMLGTFVMLDDPELKEAMELISKMYEVMKQDESVMKKFEELSARGL